MADTALLPRSPLAGLLRPGRHGARVAPPGLVLQERAGLQMAGLAARHGQEAALASAVAAAFGIALPATPRRAGDARLAFLWSGPAQWLAVAEAWPSDLEAALREVVGAHGVVTDQGDGRVVLLLAGPQVRDVLAKGLAIDLHPRAFGPDDTAATLAAHIGVQIWQRDAAPTYELAVPRSYAESLCAWLLEAGAEYSVEIQAPG